MATAVFVPSLPAEVIHAGFGEWNAPKRFFRRRIINSDLPCARCANSAYPSHDKTAFGLAGGHSDSLANLDLSLHFAQFYAAAADIDGDNFFLEGFPVDIRAENTDWKVKFDARLAGPCHNT